MRAPHFRSQTRKNANCGAIGKVKDGSLQAFILDPSDLDKVITGTSASSIAPDDKGVTYAADVGTHNLWKYVKLN